MDTGIDSKYIYPSGNPIEWTSTVSYPRENYSAMYNNGLMLSW